MKLRIQDSSIRFRVTIKELDELGSEAGLHRACLLPGGGEFRYGARVNAALAESRVVAGPSSITLELSPADWDQLRDPASEGAYIRREWTDDAGQPRRFMAFIEKDRPASTCKKVESWIYEGHDGRPEDTHVPILRKPA